MQHQWRTDLRSRIDESTFDDDGAPERHSEHPTAEQCDEPDAAFAGHADGTGHGPAAGRPGRPHHAEFANAFAASNATEIELARLAYVRAQSPDVRTFARQMLIDHRDMAIRLDNFALERGYLVAWQIEPDMLAVIDRLSTLDRASFDRAYMDEMVAAHTKAVARLQAQAASGRETAEIATEALPKVRHHLEMARELEARL